ncbi:MAG: DUF4124 domain-containing protein [Shewanella sp.]
MLNMTQFTARLVCAVWFCSLLTPAMASVIYTWVDKHGVTHYSQEPPSQEQQKASELNSQALEPAKIGYIAPTTKTEEPKVSDAEKSAALIKERDAKQAQSICDNAKHYLNVLTTHTNLIRQSADKTQEGQAMTEEERQAAITQQQERIKLFCSK